jgi:hypothetical protein
MMRRFLQTSLLFMAGLLCAVLATDRCIGWRVVRRHGKGLTTVDVYTALENVRGPDSRVKAVFLGDSVARQLFQPSAEPSPEFRFLTTNQAISVAGQYYLLEEAIEQYPRLADVYLLYYPGSFQNDLELPLSANYFCGFFHRPAQVLEVFEFKRDIRLSAVHVERSILPNLMAANDAWRPLAESSPAANRTPTASGAGSDPLMHMLDLLFSRSHEPALPLIPSATSQHFLGRMRDVCHEPHLRLHVLPCPCSDANVFDSAMTVYDGKIIYLNRSWFRDGIHLFPQHIPTVRTRVAKTYELPL